MTEPLLSVVVPARNEDGNLRPLLDEIVVALRGVLAFEIVVVDDASTDGSLARLQAARADIPELRVLAHDRPAGQSAAVRAGVKAARAPWIATLDGDGQNDPADLPKLVATRDAGDPQVKLYAGWRTVSVPVNHRARGSGASKYTNLGRALVGERDLMGVAWLIRRSSRPTVRELE